MGLVAFIALVFALSLHVTTVPGWAAPRPGSVVSPDLPLSVIQGETAERGEFPWMAQLKRDGGHLCGAVILSEQWLVTAAHCLTSNLDQSAYQVILGEYDVRVDEESEQRRGISEMKFSDLSGENDIALIKLDQPAEFSAYVKAIDLPDFEEEFAGKTAIASGWGVSGSTAVGPIYPERLQKMPMTLKSDATCMDSLVFFSFVPGPMTCAQPEAGSSLCWGDSGGALTYYRSADRPVLAGVTSWGVDCELNKRPSVFVDVGFFVDWIESVIG